MNTYPIRILGLLSNHRSRGSKVRELENRHKEIQKNHKFDPQWNQRLMSRLLNKLHNLVTGQCSKVSSMMSPCSQSTSPTILSIFVLDFVTFWLHSFVFVVVHVLIFWTTSGQYIAPLPPPPPSPPYCHLRFEFQESVKHQSAVMH